MRVGILGLSANPLTNAHLGLAKVAVPFFDEVWLLPCYNHNNKRNLIAEKFRLEMCRLVSDDKIKTCSWEIDNKSKGCAVETIAGLKKDYSGIDFSWIIGSDNANTIHTWCRWQELIKLIPFFTIKRPDSPIHEGAWYTKPPHHIIETDWESGISSSLVRDETKVKHAINNYVPNVIKEYIEKNSLYAGCEKG